MEAVFANPNSDDADIAGIETRFNQIDGLVTHEQRLAAAAEPVTESPDVRVDDSDAWKKPDSTGAEEFTIDPKRQKAFDAKDRALAASEKNGTDYYEELAKDQGKTLDRVHRDEFLELAQKEGYRATTFRKAAAEFHADVSNQWYGELEEATRGHMVKPEFGPESETNWPAESLWQVPDHEARKYMSTETAMWLDEVGGRPTLGDMTQLINEGRITVLEPAAVMAAFRQSSLAHRREDYNR